MTQEQIYFELELLLENDPANDNIITLMQEIEEEYYDLEYITEEYNRLKWNYLQKSCKKVFLFHRNFVN